jgi:hypothetical protein
MPLPANVPDTGRPRFGVNYTPRVGWFHSWLDLDLDAVGEDLEALKGLGIDHVRMFPLWPLLQPNRTLIRPRALDDVRAVVDVAGRVGLDVVVDVLQGHMSSFDFLPAWLLSWHRRNMFTDPEVVASTAQLVRELGSALADAPNLIGLSTGNETDQFSVTGHPDPHELTVAEAEHWTATLLDAARESAPDGLHSVANYDATWFMDDHSFTPDQSATLGDATVVHCWVFDGTGQRYGGHSYEVAHRAEYYIEVARGYSRTPDRPLWLQEVGAPLNVMTAEDAPWFVEQTVRNVTDCPDLYGVTWWCSHDVSPDLADFPAVEHTLGLFDSHGRIKDTGRAYTDAIAEAKQRGPAAPRGRAFEYRVGSGDLLTRSVGAPGGSVFEAWMDASRAGERPSIRIVREEPVAADGERAGDTRGGGASTTQEG